MTVDFTSGVYLRSEGARLLFGGARPDEVDGYRTDVDWPWMEQLLELGAPRFPWLADVPLDRAGCWAGTYENTPDHHGILGAGPGRADVGQRLRVLRPRHDAGPRDRPARRRADHHRRDRQHRRERAAHRAVRRQPTPVPVELVF